MHMKYAFAALVSAFGLTEFAAADTCRLLEQFASAVEHNQPKAMRDTLGLGRGETECSAMTGLEPHGLGGMRHVITSVDCYWDNTSPKSYTADDVRDMAYHLHACPVLIFEELEDFDEGIEYRFTYGEQTELLLGNDESGMYLNIFRNE